MDEAITYVGDESSELQRNTKDRIGDQEVHQKQADKTTNKAGEGINKAADMVKATTDKTVDVVNSVTEKAKETVKGAWEATKDATQNISGTSSFDNVDDLWEDHTTKPKDHTGKPRIKEEEEMVKSTKVEGR